MAYLTTLTSYTDYLSAYERNVDAMNQTASMMNLFKICFLVIAIFAVIAFVGAGVLALFTARAKMKAENARVEAAKVSANADMLEAHIKAADQQNGPLLRALMSKFSEEELLDMLKEVNTDAQKKVTSSNYSDSLDDDAKLNKQIDDLLSGFIKDDDK